MAKKVIGNWLIPLTIIIVIIALLVAFLPKVPKETIKIGAVLPLSGSLAKYGQVYQHSLDAIENITNREGGINGRNIEFVYEDNKGDATETLNAVNKLKNIENISIFFVPFSAPDYALEGLAKNGEILLIAENYDSAFAGKSKFIFNPGLGKDFDSEHAFIMNFLEKNNKCPTLFFIGLNIPSGEQLKGMVVKYYNGSILGEEMLPLAETDFRTAILKAKEKNPACTYFYFYEYQFLNLLKQAKEVGFNTTYLLIPTIDYAPILNAFGDYLEGSYVISVATDAATNPSPTGKAFFEEYIPKYGNAYANFVAETYDGIAILKEGLKKCNQADLNCLSNEMSKLKSFESSTSITTGVDDEGNVIGRNFVIAQVQNSTLVPVSSI
jgi:branched-chain amino acid transport system substrate-binding protein